MNHHHRKVLHSVFAHPVSSNLDPKQVQAALTEMGADLSHGGHGQLLVKLNGHSHGFHDTQHSLSKEEVVTLRKFLEGAGVDPVRDYPL
jgi:hypothetical protein